MKTAIFVVAFVGAFAQIPVPDCPPLTPTTIPDDVRELDLTHVKAVGAIGDSITAGFGINNGLGEIRELVYSVGGRETGTTFPTILNKHLQAPLIGTSTSNTFGFNAGISGSRVIDVPGQAQVIVDRMIRQPDLDYFADWKIVTIFIGGNNICGGCDDNPTDLPPYFGFALDQAIEVFYERTPRMVVQLVSLFNVSSLYHVTRPDPLCVVNRITCGCITNSDDATRDRMDRRVQLFNQEMRLVTDKYNNGPRRDFGVVYLPMGEDAAIPDRQHLSSLDCFHPNRIAHEKLGINVWNEITKPPSQRRHDIDWNPTIHCANDNNKRIFIG